MNQARLAVTEGNLMDTKAWAAPTVKPLTSAKDAQLGGSATRDVVLTRQAAGS